MKEKKARKKRKRKKECQKERSRNICFKAKPNKERKKSH